MALSMTDAQRAVLTAFAAALETAFLAGVEAATSGLPNYNKLDSTTRTLARVPFIDVAAALMTAMNIPGALPSGISTTVAVPQVTIDGSQGSITFVNGLLVSKVDPT